MASRLSLYFSLLFLLLATSAIVASEARNTPAITPMASKERNGGKVAMNEHFAEDDNTIHHLPAGHEEMIGLQDYGDTRANHRHDPHHPLAVKENNKKLDD